MIDTNSPNKLPNKIKERLAILRQEIVQIEQGAIGIITTSMDEPVSLLVQNETMEDLLSDYERAQSISFVARYENLPDFKKISIVKHREKFFIANMTYIRHILNEYRSIVQNVGDSVYYQNVHDFCCKMLRQTDYRKGTKVTILSIKNEDVTSKFLKWLGEHNKAIKFTLKSLEFKYIYNGILQHSDKHFSKRFVEEYISGEINYIFWKHSYLLGLIKDLLKPYHIILNQFSDPKLGPL